MTCLHLEAEHASHHPTPEETLHTKVSALAGEPAPAEPMAVMKGEDVSGRFSYEWLFNQEERDKLKEAFKALGNDNGEIQVTALTPDQCAQYLLNTSDEALPESYCAHWMGQWRRTNAGWVRQAMNFEAVYQNAEVSVAGGGGKNVTLELLALHPDTQLTWPKFCEMLATMRGEGDGGTPVRLPHQWRQKTHHLLDISEAVVMSSKILLSQVTFCHNNHPKMRDLLG